MDFTQIEFPIVIFSVLANLGLAFLVIRHRYKDISSIIFTLLATVLAIWAVVNYFSLHTSPDKTLFWVRMVLFFAVPQAVLFYLFIRQFPKTKLAIKKSVLWITLVGMAVVMLLSLSPWVFSGYEFIGGQFTPIPGMAMSIFGLFTGGLIVAGIIALFSKYKKALDIEKIQLQFVFVGLVITLLMLFVFIYLMVVIFKQTALVSLSSLFTLPLVIFMSYAVIKHHLLSIKVLAAELLTLVIVFILFIQTFVFDSTGEFVLKLIFAVAVTILGVFLVRSVIREVEQREQLENLSSELYKANIKLKEFDQLKTEFLSITSHQLRTPLSGIKGYLSMMIDGDFGKFSDEQGGILNRVKAEVDRLVRMVQDFLNVSRIESGRLVINKLEFNLIDVIKTVIKELEPAAANKDIKLSFTSPREEIKIKADPDKLKDVIVNLVDNALKYTEKGKIWVEVKLLHSGSEQHAEAKAHVATTEICGGDWVQVEVHDTGVGVDPDEIDKLFNKFQRAKGIAKVSPSGSGLGLFIAKKVVSGHGGEIWAESKGEGHGSIFTFKIPVK